MLFFTLGRIITNLTDVLLFLVYTAFAQLEIHDIISMFYHGLQRIQLKLWGKAWFTSL